MHFIEITDPRFATDIADYLPKEAFNPADYLLATISPARKTILITANGKLAEVMDGLAISKQCRSMSRKNALELIKSYRSASLMNVVGNIGLWKAGEESN